MTYQKKLFYKDDAKLAWQCAYNILRAYGRTHERSISVLKGDPNQELYYVDKQAERLNSPNYSPNKPFIGHLWQTK